jgi:hypothetical protein
VVHPRDGDLTGHHARRQHHGVKALACQLRLYTHTWHVIHELDWSEKRKAEANTPPPAHRINQTKPTPPHGLALAYARTHARRYVGTHRRDPCAEADVDAQEAEARREVADRLVELLLPRHQLGHVELVGGGVCVCVCVGWSYAIHKRAKGLRLFARPSFSASAFFVVPAPRSACRSRRASPRGPAPAPRWRTTGPRDPHRPNEFCCCGQGINMQHAHVCIQQSSWHMTRYAHMHGESSTIISQRTTATRFFCVVGGRCSSVS